MRIPANIKRIVIISLASLVAGILGYVLIGLALTIQSDNPLTVDQELVKISNEVNQVCPYIIDSETRLDNTITFPGMILQYNYTLVNVTKEEVNVLQFKNNMEERLLNQIKENPELAFFRKKGVTLNYEYKDRYGKYIYRFVFTPQKYK